MGMGMGMEMPDESLSPAFQFRISIPIPVPHSLFPISLGRPDRNEPKRVHIHQAAIRQLQ